MTKKGHQKFWRMKIQNVLWGKVKFEKFSMEFEIPFRAHKLTTIKDEMFIIDNRTRIIVYNLNNLAEGKDIIELPGLDLLDIAVCNVSNCVYVFVQTSDF